MCILHSSERILLLSIACMIFRGYCIDITWYSRMNGNTPFLLLEQEGLCLQRRFQSLFLLFVAGVDPCQLH